MFYGHPIHIGSFEIHFKSPALLLIVVIHILAGLACVIFGMMTILAKKGKGTHSKWGSIYYGLLLVVSITATVIAIARWKEDYHLFILGLISLTAAWIGRRALRNKWKRWSIIHIAGMGLSYIFLLVAFYVDNGKFLPIWKNLDPFVYWLLPVAVGIPVIVHALLHHPLPRQHFKS